jgi:hypothetical protein
MFALYVGLNIIYFFLCVNTNGIQLYSYKLQAGRNNTENEGINICCNNPFHKSR